VIDEDSLAGCVNTYFQEQSRQGVTQSTQYNTGFFGNGNVFFTGEEMGGMVSGLHGLLPKSRPWRIKTAIVFDNRQKALDFQPYLKSPSGRAFAKKCLQRI
jgi:hypothetical protein